jgi:hypothetical protein
VDSKPNRRSSIKLALPNCLGQKFDVLTKGLSLVFKGVLGEPFSRNLWRDGFN